MPSGLLRDTNVIFYHPLDNFTEHDKGVDWVASLSSFVPGIIGASGLGSQISSNPFMKLDDISGYDNVIGVDHFTVAFWSSGLFDSAERREASFDFAVSADSTRNSIAIRRLSAGGYQPRINLEINHVTSTIFIPSYPIDNGLHFVVIDVKYESASNGWQHNVSIDGSGWQNLGIDGYDGVPIQHSQFKIESIFTPVGSLILDEFVAWSGSAIFTEQELSNLYELGNTLNKPMNEYTSTFGTLVTDNIDCFTHGQDQTSGSISLYIPGQKETKSIDLFTEGYLPVSGNIDLYMSGSPRVAVGSIDLFLKVATPSSGSIDNFIHGKQIFVDSIDQYVEGHQIASGNFDLYVSGVPFITSSIDLYVKGPLQTTGSFDDIITGHETSSGNISLFIRNFTDFAAFVAVVDNNPSNTVDLFIHGIPSGASPSLYINNSIPLFIHNDGSSVEIQSTWSGFVGVDAAIAVASSGTWVSFVRGGNTVNDNIDLYINSHASGEAPRGVSTSGSFTVFIEGKSLQDGDEGLLSNGYFAKSFQASSFAKVHLGVSGTSDLYISGTMTIIPPSATLDLFVFGISGIASGSHALYILGNELITGSHDLFVLGIQGIVSGSIPLFIQVTTLGSLNTEFDLYTHGF